jgi:UDP-N-acetylglucosamine--N-acetylmuramyl-(pentapeptide) pyrophosphoryl-undecaprenol N-acetylglucosamine transferase
MAQGGSSRPRGWRCRCRSRYATAVARLAYFVHGRGRGHASRAVSLVPALRAAGHDVAVFAGGDAADLLADPHLRASAPLLPGWAGVRAAPMRLVGDLRALRELRPDAVIVDGDLPSAIAARVLGLPSIAVGHDLVFSRCRLPPGLPAHQLRAERRTSFVQSRAAVGVAVHFLPIAPARPRTYVARPALRPELAGPVSAGEHLVAYFRDRNGDGAIRRAAARGARIICFGQELAGIPGVEARPFDRDGFASALRTARGVIASAGSNVLAECVLLGKPALVLHPAGEAEPALNARLAEAAGVAVGTSFEALDDAVVARFLDRLDRGDFARVDLAAALPDAAVATLAAVDDALAG